MAFRNCILGKRNPEDGLETKPILKKHKEASVTKKTLYVGHLRPRTKMSDVIDFFKDVGEVVRVLLRRLGKQCYALVEFASSNEANKALQNKNRDYLLGYEIYLQVDKKPPYPSRPKYCIDYKVWEKDYLRREGLLIEEDETPPDFFEKVLFVANLSPQTKILHIQDFFNDVLEVVSVRLIVNPEGRHVGYGFVDFASSIEAKKALEKKNGEYLHDHKIFLEVAKRAPNPPRPKYNLAEKLCYEDSLRRQNLVVVEDDTVEGLDETPNFVEALSVREKTVSVSRLSCETGISHIINFFKDVGEVVHVRLIVDYMGKHMGDGYVEFASANEAEKALEKKNGEYLHDQMISLDVAKKSPFPPRPKYCIDYNVWYEDYLRRESLLIEEDEGVEEDDVILNFIEEVAVRRKTLFVDNIPSVSQIPTLLQFFRREVGQVAHVRLIVDHMGKHVGCGFVEFASAKEAEEALKKKNGKCVRHEMWHYTQFFLDVVEIAPYPLRPKYKLAEKLWSKREPLRIFYESLSKQIPGSEMAEFWLMEHGMLSPDKAKRAFEKKQRKMKQIRMGTPSKPAPSFSSKAGSSQRTSASKNNGLDARKMKKVVDDDEDDDDDFILSHKRRKV